jgi:hypothetical protein
MISRRLPENANLPFDGLKALSFADGLRYPHPSSLRRTSMYASFLGISEAYHLSIFKQLLKRRLSDGLPVAFDRDSADFLILDPRTSNLKPRT